MTIQKNEMVLVSTEVGMTADNVAKRMMLIGFIIFI